jgi:hypothetical protein
LIAVSSGISGYLHQWIDKCLRSDRCRPLRADSLRSRICLCSGLWFHRLSSLAYRIFLYIIIQLSCLCTSPTKQ